MQQDLSLEEIEITHKIIKSITGHFDLESVRILKLNNLFIRKIQTVNLCTNLEYLNLSNNCIKIIEGLEELTQLKNLDLSYNQIGHLSNMDTLKNLRVLNMKHNQLENIEEVKTLILLPLLQEINLQENPFCGLPDYNNIILDIVPHVSILDGEHKTLRIILSDNHNKPIDLSKADIDPEIYTSWTKTSRGDNIFQERTFRYTDADQKLESERNKFQSQILDCQKVLSKADNVIQTVSL